MGEERVSLVASVYEAFGRGDIETVLGLLQDTEWHESEGLPYGGVYRGAEAIAQNVFGPITADVPGFSARPDEIIVAGDDRVLALGRYTGSGAAGGLDSAFAHVWTVRDGRIVKFVQYADTHKFREAIGSEG